MDESAESDQFDMMGADSSPRQFVATRWSLVVDVRSDNRQISEAALGELCQRYWFPLYGFVRRSGKSREQAEDLTQGFFTQMLRLDTLSRADSEKGKLRTFLLKALKNFLANERARENAAKRGGRVSIISLDLDWAEDQFKIEPADPTADPVRQFERRWAMTVIKRGLGRLEETYRERGKETLFQALEPILVDGADKSYQQIAAHLGMREGAVRVAAVRMRQRLRAILRQVVADTLADGEDVDVELRAIITALS